MAIIKTEIFIASNFNEFKELRNILCKMINEYRCYPLQAVDLNNNIASPNNPLSKSIKSVMHSDILVLLIGEKYGGIPKDEKFSYAHLEYKTTLDKNSKTVVLPYYICQKHKNEIQKKSSNSKLEKCLDEVKDNHTVAFYNTQQYDQQTIASFIFQDIQKAIYDSLTSSEQTHLDIEEYKNEDFNDFDLDKFSDDEMEYLEQRSGIDLNSIEAEDEFETELDAISNPAKAAALEQRKEAIRALELGERAIAINHLRQSLHHRPLDLEVNYWLARLLISTSRRSDCREAIDYAKLAAKLANSEGRPIRVAVAYVLAAQGALKSGDCESSLSYINMAIEAAPWLAVPHLELANQLAHQSKLEEAFESAEQAFYRNPYSIIKLNRYPIFSHYPEEFKKFKKKI